ncbi:MAG: transketolase [Candidatus Omnitrophica bacterium]|nr:transketolase [Candidatus Omnitrophota bacterium]
MKEIDIQSLEEKAIVCRKEILQIIHSAACGHPGGSLSAVEILIALYAFGLRHDPKNPQWEERDRLIISKGHASPATYVVLANFEYFSKDEYPGYRKFGSILQGHVHRKVPGVEFNTGSLGHGLSVANGMALGAKMQNKDTRVFCLLGDGEIQEGSVWEAAMTAAHHNIDHVCAIIDYNKVQENGPVKDIKALEPLADKWKSFGWNVVDVDGHDYNSLQQGLDDFKQNKGKPFVIIANTVKGKGVSFMEGQSKWHGKAPNDDQLKKALSELST